MAHYDLEEQEQLDSLKTWWKMNGNLVTGAVVVAALAVIGWTGWNRYQASQAGQAAVIYGALQQAVAMNDGQRVKAAAGELSDKFAGTAYAPLGAMLAARLSFDSGDLKNAQAQLTWAAEHGKDEVKDLARLRLAAVLLDEKAYDDALKQLDGTHTAAFDARFAEMKGDVLGAQGKKAEARAAYQQALGKPADKAGEKAGEKAADKANGKTDTADKSGPTGVYREVLQQKLDSLGAEA